MSTITIVTRSPEAIAAYFGFGWHEVDRGRSKFGDYVIIAEGPQEHANWQAMRLGSGNHGARIVDDLAAWQAEWGYVSNTPAWESYKPPFNPDNALQLVADDWPSLRRCDVYRLFDSVDAMHEPREKVAALLERLMAERPDLKELARETITEIIEQHHDQAAATSDNN